jgi:O-methyltransferase
VPATAADLYTDLLIECVNGSVHGTPSQLIARRPASPVKKRVAAFLADRNRYVASSEQVGADALNHGVGWPEGRWSPGESMIGRERLRQLRDASVTVLREQIPGDMIETGVWRGGACILMKGVLKAYDDTERRVVVADSFEGLPPADDGDDAAALHNDKTLAISREEVMAAFERYGLLDDRVEFLEGWFSETLPNVKHRVWSIIRLDGDMYESTKNAIENLYSGLSVGGYVIVDDYLRYESCRGAIDEFRQLHDITTSLRSIDSDGVFWRKEN